MTALMVCVPRWVIVTEVPARVATLLAAQAVVSREGAIRARVSTVPVSKAAHVYLVQLTRAAHASVAPPRKTAHVRPALLQPRVRVLVLARTHGPGGAQTVRQPLREAVLVGALQVLTETVLMGAIPPTVTLGTGPTLPAV